jgi:cholestenol delta-isomerase
MLGETMPNKQSHPYFPQDSAISGYVPNNAPLLAITGAFGGIIAVFLLGCISLARWYNPALKKAEQLAIGWFVLCKSPFSTTLDKVVT